MNIPAKQEVHSLLQNLVEYHVENLKPIIVINDRYNIVEINQEACNLLCDSDDDYKNVSWLDFCRVNRITECGSLDANGNEGRRNVGFRTVKKNHHQEIKNIIQWDIIYFDRCYIMVGYIIAEGHKNSNTAVAATLDTRSIFGALSNSLTALVKNFHSEHFIEPILRQIVDSLFEHANLKNNRFEYIALSPKSRKVLGVRSIEEVVGKTVDILRLPKKYNDQIHEVDEEAYNKKTPMVNVDGEPFTDSNGKITKLILNKIPLINNDGEVVFLLTLSIDSNSMCDPFVVRRMYKVIYKSKKVAHEKFLQHYSLEKFKSLETGAKITQREIDVMMLLTLHNNVKMVANDLKIDGSTVRKNIDSIKLKLGCVNKLEVVELFLSHVKEANIQLEAPV